MHPGRFFGLILIEGNESAINHTSHQTFMTMAFDSVYEFRI